MIGVAQIVQSGGRPVIHQNLKEFANLLFVRLRRTILLAMSLLVEFIQCLLEEAIASGTVPPPHNFMYKH